MSKNYKFDKEGNIVSRAEALREIEKIEREINEVEDPETINEMRARWNYLMSVT